MELYLIFFLITLIKTRITFFKYFFLLFLVEKNFISGWTQKFLKLLTETYTFTLGLLTELLAHSLTHSSICIML